MRGACSCPAARLLLAHHAPWAVAAACTAPQALPVPGPPAAHRRPLCALCTPTPAAGPAIPPLPRRRPRRSWLSFCGRTCRTCLMTRGSMPPSMTKQWSLWTPSRITTTSRVRAAGGGAPGGRHGQRHGTARCAAPARSPALAANDQPTSGPTPPRTRLPPPRPAGYLFNIAFLKRVFQPTFVLHDVRRTGPLELTTRWTMVMGLAVGPK